MPICEKHKEEKILSGKRYKCKSCNKEYQQKWYSENQKEQIARVAQGTKKYRDLNREFVIDYLEKNPCVSCGEDDIVVLEFDHLRDKKFSIGRMIHIATSTDALKDEIDKCEVLCANCLKRKKAKAEGLFKFKAQQEDEQAGDQ